MHKHAQVSYTQSIDFCQLIRLANHLHARAQRAILVNAPFQNAKWYFGYCQISLNTEKIIICQYFFAKEEG